MDNFSIRTFTGGLIENNMYLVTRERKGVVVDPSFTQREAKGIIREMEKECDALEAVLITHGHYDHISGLGFIRGRFPAPVFCHERDAGKLAHPLLNGSALFGSSVRESPAEKELKDGATLSFLGLNFRVIHTPGHSAGSVCILLEGKYLFSGDTIFESDMGRTDLPDGSFDAIMDSIQSRILVLPDEVIIYPGHGPATTVGKEKRHYTK